MRCIECILAEGADLADGIEGEKCAVASDCVVLMAPDYLTHHGTLLGGLDTL